MPVAALGRELFFGFWLTGPLLVIFAERRAIRPRAGSPPFRELGDAVPNGALRALVCGFIWYPFTSLVPVWQDASWTMVYTSKWLLNMVRGI